MDVKIQPASIDNLIDIQELNRKLCTKEYKEFDPTINKDYPIQEEGEAYFKERILQDGGCALVAIVDNKVAGYLVGAIIEPESYRNVAKIAEAENMFVLEEFRGLGIGAKLLQEFFTWCKSKDVKRIRTIASAQNARAIEFYKRAGFLDYDLILEKELSS